MLTEIRHRSGVQHPNKVETQDFWTGTRHDGVFFVAPTREKLETFSECACQLGSPCPEHAAQAVDEE